MGCGWMPHQVFPALISLSWEEVCPLPVLVCILVPLLLPCSLRGALLCNARCIRCIFIPHYFTPQRPLLETGDAAIWKKGLTLCCVTVSCIVSFSVQTCCDELANRSQCLNGRNWFCCCSVKQKYKRHCIGATKMWCSVFSSFLVCQVFRLTW